LATEKIGRSIFTFCTFAQSSLVATDNTAATSKSNNVSAKTQVEANLQFLWNVVKAPRFQIRNKSTQYQLWINNLRFLVYTERYGTERIATE